MKAKTKTMLDQLEPYADDAYNALGMVQRIRRICVILFILVSATGCGQKKTVLEMEGKITSWERPLDMEMIYSEEEGNFCIVIPGKREPTIIPDRYYIEATAYTGTTYKIKDSSHRIKKQIGMK